MKKILCLVVLVVGFSSFAHAYSDIGLLKAPRTLSYFLLVPTDASSISSGLVFNQKQNDKMALEVSMTAYKSFYLLTRNVTKIRIDEKYKLVQWGSLGLTGLAGAAFYYAPNVGLGLAADVGGIAVLNIMENLAVSLPVNGIIFRDGMEINIEPEINYLPPFWKDIETYAGVRIEGSMIGFSSDGSQGGRFNFYANFGVRGGI